MFTAQCGDQWVCADGTCRLEVVVVSPSMRNDGTSFRCCCGGEMVRKYRAPIVRRVEGEEAESFLRESGIGGVLRPRREPGKI
jgi:hypothetical protein